MTPALDATLCFALATCVAQAGSALPLHDRRAGLARKADGSIVTAADLACERKLRQLAAPHLNGIPVIGEETAAEGDAMPDAPLFALVDPLDGTAAYADGRDDYSVNLALVRDGAPVLGILALPAQRRIFAGLVSGNESLAVIWHYDAQGRISGAGTPVHVRRGDGVLTGLVSERHGDAESEAALQRAGIAARQAASSASKFAMIAEGAGDLYPRYGATMAWDTAAGQALLESAGGCVIDPATGTSLRYPPGRALRNGPFIAASSIALARRAAGIKAA